MGYDGRAVANFILDVCDAHDRRVSNLSMQKIVYFCHVWSLIELGKPLVKHVFEAWEYGPVLPYLYREFRQFDKSAITSRAQRLDPNLGRNVVAEYDFDESTRSLLEQVVEFYSRLSAGDLVRLSHVEGGPWHTSWHHAGVVNPGMKIGNAEIAAFYSSARTPFSIM